MYCTVAEYLGLFFMVISFFVDLPILFMYCFLFCVVVCQCTFVAHWASSNNYFEFFVSQFVDIHCFDRHWNIILGVHSFPLWRLALLSLHLQQSLPLVLTDWLWERKTLTVQLILRYWGNREVPLTLFYDYTHSIPLLPSWEYILRIVCLPLVQQSQPGSVELTLFVLNIALQCSRLCTFSQCSRTEVSSVLPVGVHVFHYGGWCTPFAETYSHAVWRKMDCHPWLGACGVLGAHMDIWRVVPGRWGALWRWRSWTNQ